MKSNPGQAFIDTLTRTHDLWVEIFGRRFSERWGDSSSALRIIASEGCKILNNAFGRTQAHLTILLREPLLDRLEIEVSTQTILSRGAGRPDTTHVPNLSENWDGDRQTVYYRLCDRILPPDATHHDDAARKLRGLTGWVAVTGHFLKVNYEGAKEVLEHLEHERLDTSQMIGKYGNPYWSRRTDEFPPDPAGMHLKRFLAVPIKTEDSDRPAGVMRYTCPLHEAELTSIDRFALERLAQMASAVINASTVRSRIYRDERLLVERARLQDTSNVRQFLTFLAKAMDARIASAYIRVKTDSGEVLRLLDAVGISDEVWRCRSQLKDYRSDGDGLTAEIWRRSADKPFVTQSVRDRTSWKGFNTEVFYKKSFKEWGISLSDSGQLPEALKDYPIPLLGTALINRTEHIGVLKVEFPTSGRVLRQFNEDDSNFFEIAARLFTEELVAIDRMLKGDWWSGEDSIPSGESCVRRYLEIMRTSLVSDKDCPEFWKAAKNFLDQGSDSREAAEKVAERLTPTDRSIYAEVFREISKGGIAGTSYALFKMIMEVLLGSK
ncbi:MAG: hypothetical protein LUO89_01945 [Methanothrix sp.]|nr:hypothetical protein [Methanothrix sp.]